MRAFARTIMAGILLAGTTLSMAAAQPADHVDDLVYRSALYDHHLGHHSDARIKLLRARRNSGGELDSHRQALLARTYVEAGLYQDARQAFSQLQTEKMPQDALNQVYMALARLYFSQDRCPDVVGALEKTDELPLEQDAHARYMRASCLTAADLTLEQASQAEMLLQKGADAKEGIYPGRLWYAYGFYNLAVAAANAGLLEPADGYYLKALDYTDGSAEGQALVERILLSRASVNYALNRFDFAMKAYQQLPLDSLWRDKALLHYGWAAFRNYSPGVALESWRQLVNLPFKSMSVYQGYLAIPYALEQASAQLQALESYQYAIEQYSQVTEEIDRLTSRLTLQKISGHAVAYYNSRGRYVEPLHPLLASTYAQEDFRLLVEQIGDVMSQKQRLQDQQALLQMFDSYYRDFDSRAADRESWRNEVQMTVYDEVQAVDARLDAMIEGVLRDEMNKEAVDPQLQQEYRRYAVLKKQADAGNVSKTTADKLYRLRGVLLMQLIESDQQVTDIEVIMDFMNRYHKQLVRFSEFRMLNRQGVEGSFDGEAIKRLSQSVSQAEQQADQLLMSLQTRLLQKTRTALDEQRDRIELYKTQARIASANLKEEFYQQGGSRLWQ